ncbi:MAG: hypothetical protein ACI4RA_09970 [Kiritimatiellia bacterium]
MNICHSARLFPFCAFALAAGTLFGDIVTNDYFTDVTSPTVLRGVTNIIAKTKDVTISADLTLDNRTFLWLKGDTGAGLVNLAPTANDATLTIQGNSGFFAAYRYSGDGNNANSEWAKVGIDELNKNIPSCHYNIRIGTSGGAPGSTGSGKIVVKTAPKFGYNAVGGIWARYLYVETSPRANSEGYVDILDIANEVTADIAHIENKSPVHPARILFRGGTLLRNNATNVDAPLSPAAGATLVVWSVDGAEIKFKKQFADSHFTGRKGGTVRIVGTDLRLTSSGYTPAGDDRNFRPWNLANSDHVVWELGGNITLAENAWIRTTDDNMLPYGPGTGRMVIQYNSSVKEANVAKQVPYCCLDLCGTEQHLNGVVSTGTGYQIGVVTNSHETATGRLVLGAGDVDATLNAKCMTRVAVVKEGKGLLDVQNTTAEELTVASPCAVTFSGESAFTNLTVAADSSLNGTVVVRSRAVFGAGAFAATLNLHLGAAATVSAGGAVRVFAVTRGGGNVAPGEYPAATTDWVESGTVIVTSTVGAPVADIAWTGGGATDSASLAANWSDGGGAFSSPRGRPVFAEGGARAVLDGGVSHFWGLKFAAAGDFTVVTNGPTDAVRLYASIDVARPETEAPTVAHTYTLAAPIMLSAKQEITFGPNMTNMTVNLLGGIESAFSFGLTFSGVKKSDLPYDYVDCGSLVLENPRISGPIVHKLGGGWLILRGDVGNPGDTQPLELDYLRYRNNRNGNDGLMFGGLTRVENATIWKPVSIEGQGQVGGIADRWFICAPNTTNVFKELVSCGPSTAITVESGGTVIFEKGVHVRHGGFNARALSGTPLFVFNGPVKVDDTNRAFDPGSSSLLDFNSTGSYARFCFQTTHSTSRFNIDDAFIDTGFVFNSELGRFELGTTHQRAAWLISGAINASNAARWFADNAAKRRRGTVNGAYPSAFEITQGAPTESATSVTNCGVQFTGWVTLEKSGAGWHRMLPMAYASYGDVEVSGGTLMFDAGATWLNGTNVTVKGSGTLRLGSGGTFQDACVVKAEGEEWTLDLTGSQKAELFIVDGRKMPGGVYGASVLPAAHPLRGRFAGTGALIVRNAGMAILIR